MEARLQRPGTQRPAPRHLGSRLRRRPVLGGARRRRSHALTKFDGSYDAPDVSPDGSNVAFLGADDAKTYPQNVHVGVLPAGGGEHRWLSRQLDRTFETTAGGLRCCGSTTTTLLAAAEDRGETHLYRVTLDGCRTEGAHVGADRRELVRCGRAAPSPYAAGAVDAVSDIFVRR